MVAAINQIGHTIGAKTIAEFVEDDASLSCLRQMKVDYAQGYGLRMPTPLSQLAEELDKRIPGDSGHVIEQWIQDSADTESDDTESDDTGPDYSISANQPDAEQTAKDSEEEQTPFRKAS